MGKVPGGGCERLEQLINQIVIEIEDLSNEIANEMRHEPMTLQPQAGFGSAQEEVDRIYDYMQEQIKCKDLHYVGTKDNSGTYQDGAYAVCLDVSKQNPTSRFDLVTSLF